MAYYSFWVELVGATPGLDYDIVILRDGIYGNEVARQNGTTSCKFDLNLEDGTYGASGRRSNESHGHATEFYLPSAQGSTVKVWM